MAQTQAAIAGEDDDRIALMVENPAGKKFKCRVHKDTKIANLSGRFFQYNEWSSQDRAVAELVRPENPGETKRLQGDHTLDGAGLRDGDTIRIFPEAVAGAVNQDDRIRALVADYNDMEALAEWNEEIRFTPNKTFAPTLYDVEFHMEGFEDLGPDRKTPVIRKRHEVEIVLVADYPLEAPDVRWKTKIFHPNIHPKTKHVCLGVLRDRYRPNIGLARIVTMLSEMICYQNYDMTSALNKEAAEWASKPENWPHIQKIGGMPYQGPIKELMDKLTAGTTAGAKRTESIDFTPI